ncbi:hypothetical protein, partial [Brevibacterium aurantiacum]|uniref:hypothetical protein n=1 Tax=Brevibacterium aurantiacum TaxID=273384 RepID=UPI001D0288FB
STPLFESRPYATADRWIKVKAAPMSHSTTKGKEIGPSVMGKKMMPPKKVAIGSNQELIASSTGDLGASAAHNKVFMVQ